MIRIGKHYQYENLQVKKVKSLIRPLVLHKMGAKIQFKAMPKEGVQNRISDSFGRLQEA